MLFNWQLGRDLVIRKAEEKWGSGIVEQVSLDLQAAFPDVKGFSARNLWNMKKWYSFYAVPESTALLSDLNQIVEHDQEKLQQVAAEIPSEKLQQVVAEYPFPIAFGYCISSVYDVLEEKFIENGDYEALPGNEQTLRNYVHYLVKTGQIDTGEEHRRIYDHVFDTPPGEQMLIDFGEVTLGKKASIHFICLLLRYSRFLCVYAQDHKYNAPEACQAIYRSFCKLQGRPSVLVIDQDAVFVASETYGEVVKTRVFEDFCTEQELKLWVCNKADPESKGPIENSVGFVKKNFFSARTITCIDDVWRSLPGWLNRKNRRIHRATLHIPAIVFRDIEQKALKPLLPSVYETSPNSFTTVTLQGMPYVLYKSCRYSVPREYAYATVKYKTTSGKIHIYDENLNFICTHLLSERKGSFNQLPEHKKGEADNWIEIVERLRGKWNCYDFQHFMV